MVHVDLKLSEDESRSFIESLGGDTEHTSFGAKTSVKLGLLNSKYKGAEGDGSITLRYTKKTGRITITGKLATLDGAADAVGGLATCYETLLRNGTVLPPPLGAEKAAGQLRFPIRHGYKAARPGAGQGAREELTPAVYVPQDQGYRTAIADVAKYASSSLAEFPEWRDRLHILMIQHMGLDASYFPDSYAAASPEDLGQ
jgi:hypothetical protein